MKEPKLPSPWDALKLYNLKTLLTVVLHVVVTTIEGQFFGLLPAVAISFCIQIDLKKAEKHYA